MIESLKTDEHQRSKWWKETLQKQLTKADRDKAELYREIRKVQEEVQAKSSQVKQYKKQVDSLQRELQEARNTVEEYRVLLDALQRQVKEASERQLMESQQHYLVSICIILSLCGQAAVNL